MKKIEETNITTQSMFHYNHTEVVSHLIKTMKVGNMHSNRSVSILVNIINFLNTCLQGR